jgi:hypothetical protein
VSSRYASGTAVSCDRSKTEIERTLHRYGATAFVYGTKPDKAVIQFEMSERRIRFNLPLPGPKEALRLSSAGNVIREHKEVTDRRLEQMQRQRWRALSLAVKAKLEAVASGITTFEEEFLAHLVLPSGRTVAEETMPQIVEAYSSGKVKPLMLEGK